MEERIRQKLEEIKTLYDEGQDEKFTAFGSGILAGVNQTLLWLLEPADWAEPLSTIPGYGDSKS